MSVSLSTRVFNLICMFFGVYFLSCYCFSSSFSSGPSHYLPRQWIYCGCQCFCHLQGQQTCLYISMPYASQFHHFSFQATRQNGGSVVLNKLLDLSQHRRIICWWNLQLWVCDAWRVLPHLPHELHADFSTGRWEVHLCCRMWPDHRFTTSSNKWQLWCNINRWVDHVAIVNDHVTCLESVNCVAGCLFLLLPVLISMSFVLSHVKKSS